MNKERLKTAIRVIERSKEHGSLMMSCFQSDRYGHTVNTRLVDSEKEFHACGNKACFAGHIAVSPEFQADGGKCGCEGSPIFNDVIGDEALSKWLELSNPVIMDSLVYRSSIQVLKIDNWPFDFITRVDGSKIIYGVDFADIKSEDLLKVLNQLLELGEEEFVNFQMDKLRTFLRERGYELPVKLSSSRLMFNIKNFE